MISPFSTIHHRRGHTLVNTFRAGDCDFQYVYDTGAPALANGLEVRCDHGSSPFQRSHWRYLHVGAAPGRLYPSR